MTAIPVTAVCPAPDLVMDFAPDGNVHACCVNAVHPLGNVRTQSLRAIWDGERAQALRAALRRGDFGYGCGSCRHRLEHGTGPVDLEYYRRLPPSRDESWPELMAFGLHNTCNLACVMCGGNLSSKLRALEGRPPLRPAYGDRFFDELAEFLPHLRRAEFRGGEPFLVREHHRVWDLIIDLGLDLTTQVTTNGTVWNERVEQVLDALPMQVTFSMDGVTAATNEAIRVGTDQAVVLENARRFAVHARERGTRFDLSFCVLRRNWHELADLVRFADRMGVEAHAQLVLEREEGLQRLPTGELTAVVAELERQGDTLRDELDLDPNRRVWDELLTWLHAELSQRARGVELRLWETPAPENAGHVARTRRQAAVAEVDVIACRRAELAAWSPSGEVWEVVTGGDDRVVRADEPWAELVGLTFTEAVEALADRLGPHLWVADENLGPDGCDQTLFLTPTPLREKAGVVVRLVSLTEKRSAGGRRHTLVATDTWFADVDGQQR